MSWLGPAFLFALPLLGLPVLLHFWRKRQKDAVPWGAMQFLIADDPRQRNVSNIDRWLILIARCLALACLIFALARPLVISERFGTRANDREDVLVLDRSLSTSLAQGDRSTFDALRDAAAEWLDSRDNGTTVGVLLAGGQTQWLGGDVVVLSAQTREALREMLDDLRPVAARADMLESVRQALTVPVSVESNESKQTAVPRHVWTLSDRQASDWQADDPAWNALLTQVANHPQRFLHVGFADGLGRVLSNVAVTELTAETPRVPVQEPVPVTATIENLGLAESNSFTVSWLLDGKEFDREALAAIPGDDRRTVETTVVLPKAKTYVLKCRVLKADAFPADDAAETVLEAVAKVPVLLVTDEELGQGRLSAAGFFEAAIGRLDGATTRSLDSGATPWRAIFEPTRLTSDDFATANLSSYHAIVLLDPPAFSQSTLDRLNGFVNDGGGLWVCLGDRGDMDEFNRTWADLGTGLTSARLTSMAVYSVDDQTLIDASFPGRVSPPSADHPVLTTLADTQRSDLDRVLIRRHYLIDRDALSEDDRVLLRTSGGDPLSILSTRGRGRVILQTVPFDAAWTNWMLTRSFVVMTNRWLNYLTEPLAPTVTLSPRSRVRRRLKSSATWTPVVHRPDGTDDEVATVVIAGTRSLRYGQTDVAGVYRVADVARPKKTLFAFAVTRPRGESLLTPFDDAFTSRLSDTPRVAVSRIDNDRTVWLDESAVSGTDVETEEASVPKLALWTPLLVGLLCLLVFELMLSSFASIRRFGRRPVSADVTRRTSTSARTATPAPAMSRSTV